MNVRSITYAPGSIHGGRVRVTSTARPAWILCRRQSDFPIQDDVALQRLAEQGRVRPDDFLVNVSCDSRVRAKEVPEVRLIFRRAAVRRIERFSPWLARAITTLWPVSHCLHRARREDLCTRGL